MRLRPRLWLTQDLGRRLVPSPPLRLRPQGHPMSRVDPLLMEETFPDSVVLEIH